MARLAGWPLPRAGSIRESLTMIEGWPELAAARADTDARIVAWADNLDPAGLDGTLTWYSASAGRNMAKPRWVAVVHLFNHQTHHRGQVHAALTAAGVDPGVTDLPFMPEE